MTEELVKVAQGLRAIVETSWASCRPTPVVGTDGRWAGIGTGTIRAIMGEFAGFAKLAAGCSGVEVAWLLTIAVLESG